jgi:hypothetical protein
MEMSAKMYDKFYTEFNSPNSGKFAQELFGMIYTYFSNKEEKASTLLKKIMMIDTHNQGSLALKVAFLDTIFQHTVSSPDNYALAQIVADDYCSAIHDIAAEEGKCECGQNKHKKPVKTNADKPHNS